MVRKTKEATAETRERILDAALEVFAERGLSQMTFQEIARAARMTRGAVYWHFADKTVLCDCLIEERAVMPMEEVLVRFGKPGAIEPPVELGNSFVALLDAFITNPQLRRILECMMLKAESFFHAEAIRSWHQRCMVAWTMHVARCISAARDLGGTPFTLSVYTTGEITWIMLHGLLRSWLVDPSGFDLMAQGRQMINVFTCGLQAGGLPKACGGDFPSSESR